MNLVPTSKYWMSTIYLYPEIIGCLLWAGPGQAGAGRERKGMKQTWKEGYSASYRFLFGDLLGGGEKEKKTPKGAIGPLTEFCPYLFFPPPPPGHPHFCSHF